MPSLQSRGLRASNSTALQPGQVAQILLQWPRWAAPEDLARAMHLLARQNPSTASQNDASAHRRMLTDAHLAALAIEYHAELVSGDADFARFPGLRRFNPLKQKRQTR